MVLQRVPRLSRYGLGQWGLLICPVKVDTGILLGVGQLSTVCDGVVLVGSIDLANLVGPVKLCRVGWVVNRAVGLVCLVSR